MYDIYPHVLYHKIGDTKANPFPLPFGIRQGSVLGPFFPKPDTPLSKIMQKHGVGHHFCIFDLLFHLITASCFRLCQTLNNG